MQLQGAHLDDTACAVDFYRAHESQVYAGDKKYEQAQREYEPKAGQFSEEVQAWYYVADKNQHESENDNLQVVPHEVQTALTGAEQP